MLSEGTPLRFTPKSGSIPVTVLTILTIVVFTFALISFSVSVIKAIGKITDASAFITKSEVQARAQAFTGAAGPFVFEDKRKEGIIGFRKEVVHMKVTINAHKNPLSLDRG